VIFFSCFFFIDHELKPEQLRIAKITCGVQIEPLEPLFMTLGTNLYGLAFIPSIVGLYISRDENHEVPAKFSWLEFRRFFMRGLPCGLAFFLFVPSWSGYSKSFRLFIKCFVPCSALNFFLFAYSGKWLAYNCRKREKSM
jgi:hypothetical protein